MKAWTHTNKEKKQHFYTKLNKTPVEIKKNLNILWSFLGYSFFFFGQLTSNDSMRWHSCIKRFVPRILIFTDRSNFSSNLTVAAEWNTMEMVRHNIFWQEKIKRIYVIISFFDIFSCLWIINMFNFRNIYWIRLTWSLSDIPSSSDVMSPQIGITLLSSFGLSCLILSKSYI